MPFRRFIIWGVERMFELHLAVVAVLAVRFLLPVGDASYTSLSAFAAGVRDAWRNGADDAAFMTSAFMNGDGWFYAWKTYVATVYVAGFYLYLQSLYLFTSLLARRISDGRDTLFSVAAFLVSCVIFCGLHVQAHDPAGLRLAMCLLLGGLAVVSLSAAFGKLFGGRPVPAKIVSRPPLRGPAVSAGYAEAAAKPAGYSVFRRKALYFSE